MGYTNHTRPAACARGMRGSFFVIAFALLMLAFAVSGWAQSTVGTGSITGAVTDPSGAGCERRQGNHYRRRNRSISESFRKRGWQLYVGPSDPGTYKVQVSAKGFSSVNETIRLEVGNTATANIKLQLGQESQIIEVQASTVR